MTDHHECPVTGFDCLTCDGRCDLEARMLKEAEQARRDLTGYETLDEVRKKLKADWERRKGRRKS